LPFGGYMLPIPPVRGNQKQPLSKMNIIQVQDGVPENKENKQIQVSNEKKPWVV